MESMDFIAPIAAMAAKTNRKENGDYIDDDGFLCCGKCRTRKQTAINIGGVTRKVSAMCSCKAAQYNAAKAEAEKKMEMDKIKRLKSESLMDTKIRSATFDSFKHNRDNDRIFSMCKRYAENFDYMLSKNQGLLLYGPPGTGKTYSAACIANYLLDRKVPVVMTSFVKLMNSMQRIKDDDEKLISRLNQAQLLIIDDLGAERGSDFTLEKVYNVVDSRYRARKPIILTTNLSLNQMQETTDLRYSRIYDRIFEMCYPIQYIGKSFRNTEAAKRFEDMKTFLEG